MLDVDHFKAYNDAFGHPAGDRVLRGVAAALREGTRTQDVVARYGGEEFVILLPATGAGDALVLAERLRARIAERIWPLRPVTASLGVATTGDGIDGPGALVESADRALYHAKRSGRNRACHHSQSVARPVPPGAARGGP
jgi:diguanylate cyclase (GGDEF)-like protein